MLECIVTQHSLSKGLKIYGEQNEFAIKKKLKQLHDMATFQPFDVGKLTEEEKQKAIALLMFFN